MLYKAGKAVKELRFDAQGTDKLNWFDASRLKESSWGDIETEPRNYFSIGGDVALHRNFFISRHYRGCPGDEGWLVTAGTVCDWEKHHPMKNTILYSKLATYINWNQFGEIKII